MYGECVSKVGDILNCVVEVDVVKKSSVWFSYNYAKLGQGRENVKKFLQESLDLLKEIYSKVRAHYNLNAGVSEEN